MKSILAKVTATGTIDGEEFNITDFEIKEVMDGISSFSMSGIFPEANNEQFTHIQFSPEKVHERAQNLQEKIQDGLIESSIKLVTETSEEQKEYEYKGYVTGVQCAISSQGSFQLTVFASHEDILLTLVNPSIYTQDNQSEQANKVWSNNRVLRSMSDKPSGSPLSKSMKEVYTHGVENANFALSGGIWGDIKSRRADANEQGNGHFETICKESEDFTNFEWAPSAENAPGFYEYLANTLFDSNILFDGYLGFLKGLNLYHASRWRKPSVFSNFVRFKQQDTHTIKDVSDFTYRFAKKTGLRVGQIVAYSKPSSNSFNLARSSSALTSRPDLVDGMYGAYPEEPTEGTETLIDVIGWATRSGFTTDNNKYRDDDKQPSKGKSENEKVKQKVEDDLEKQRTTIIEKWCKDKWGDYRYRGSLSTFSVPFDVMPPYNVGDTVIIEPSGSKPIGRGFLRSITIKGSLKGESGTGETTLSVSHFRPNDEE